MGRARGRFVGMRKLIALVLVVLAVSVGATPAEAKRPRLIVKPSTDLHHRSKLHVQAKNWPSSTGIQITQCNGNWPADGVAACGPWNLNGTTQPDGSVTKVRTFAKVGDVGNGTCGTSDADNDCLMVMMTCADGFGLSCDPASAVTVPLTFIPPR